MRGLLRSSLETAELGPGGFKDVGRGPGSSAGDYIDWLTIRDQAQSVVDDVTRIRQHPLVPPTIAIYGYIYDVKTGRLAEVAAATRAGAAAATSRARAQAV
jgi:carbonic anhydrase